MAGPFDRSLSVFLPVPMPFLLEPQPLLSPMNAAINHKILCSPNGKCKNLGFDMYVFFYLGTKEARVQYKKDCEHPVTEYSNHTPTSI